ncbi:MAG: thioredoxin [Blastocatellia bacterium]|nr:thioredoxin [Blastocatellia bacterium]
MASELVREIDSSEFAELIKGARPVLVDFHATWCGPCKVMEPIIERLAEQFAGQAEIVKVNIDKSPDAAANNGVRSVPTFMLFAEGRLIDRVVGTSSQKQLAALIAPYLDQGRSTGAKAVAPLP